MTSQIYVFLPKTMIESERSVNQVDAKLFYLGSAYLVWARQHLKYFCNMCILGYFMSILLFPAPPHHQYGKCSQYCWCILTICIYGRYLGVQNMAQFPFLMLWQPISEWNFWAWKYDMLAKIQYLCSGGKNKVCMRDHDLWFIPYGYEMDDCVVFGAPY